MNLAEKTRDELVTIATDLGLDVGRLGKKAILDKLNTIVCGKELEIEVKKGKAPQLEELEKKEKPVVNVYKNKLTDDREASADVASVATIKKELQSYVERGLKIEELNSEYWHFVYKDKEDSGNSKLPLKIILRCARVLMGL